MRIQLPARLTMTCVVLPLLFTMHFASAEPLVRGHVFFASDFATPDSIASWNGGKLDAGRLLIEQDKTGGTYVVSRPLPVEAMRGCLIYVSATVQAENVSERPAPYNGVKLMGVIETAVGKQWPQAQLPVGSFDARKVSLVMRVPSDATGVSLVLGLEKVAGKVWFDDLRVTLGRAIRTDARAPRPAGQEDRVFTGRSETRLRGVMISPSIDEDGLRTLGQTWGANLIRWQLIHNARGGKAPSLAEYDAWLDGELAKLDRALPLCEKYGLRVVIDLHSPPGGKPVYAGAYSGANGTLSTDIAAQEKFVEVWKRMAAKYRDAAPVWGYDLANEPVDDATAEPCEDWQGLAERTAKAVRAIDPKKAIIVEPPNWGGPAGFIGFLPIDVPGVVYSFHIYEPHQFTHQGVHDDKHLGLKYPGEVNGRQWDKAALEKAMRPAAEFQKKYGVHLYVGELSAIRWAPEGSAHRYLKDCIEIFEANQWDWSYHAFREWQGWSVEHGDDRKDTKRSETQTEREKLLREWFGKNRG